MNKFYRQVRATAKLNRPNVVTAYDASEHKGIHYIVMESVEAKDLSDNVVEWEAAAGHGGHSPTMRCRELTLTALGPFGNHLSP